MIKEQHPILDAAPFHLQVNWNLLGLQRDEKKMRICKSG
jgi:hypothetical protein